MPDKDVVKTSIELPAGLLKRAKIRAVEEGSDFRTLVIEGLEIRLKAARKTK